MSRFVHLLPFCNRFIHKKAAVLLEDIEIESSEKAIKSRRVALCQNMHRFVAAKKRIRRKTDTF